MVIAWLFRGFFLIIGICIVIAAGKWLKDFLTPEKTCRAVLTVKARQEFPYSLASARKNKEEYLLTFRLLSEEEEGKERTFEVRQKLYESLDRGTVGILTWRGDWLRSFQVLTVPEKPADAQQTEEEQNEIQQMDEE